MPVEDVLKSDLDRIVELSNSLAAKGEDDAKYRSQQIVSLVTIERTLFAARETVHKQEEQTAKELRELRSTQAKIQNLSELVDFHRRYISYCDSQHHLDSWIDHEAEALQGDHSIKGPVQRKLSQFVDERTKTAEELGELRARAFRLRVRHTDLVKALDSKRITEVAGTLNSKARLVGNILRDIQKDFKFPEDVAMEDVQEAYSDASS